jgi:hypothetical protein
LSIIIATTSQKRLQSAVMYSKKLDNEWIIKQAH